MILFIDTTDFNKIIFALSEGKKLWKKTYKVDPHKSHETLGFLEKFFKAQKVKPEQVKKIVVNKGPGSYTGTRVGVTIALALGFAWNVPVQALKNDKFEKAIKAK